MHNKVLITGITGFLGSHLARHLLIHNFEIVAWVRRSSNMHRCIDFAEKINFCYEEDENFELNIHKFNPSIIIHCAWIGVTSFERESLELQLKNLELTDKLINIAKGLNINKFICLGSQAEYGFIDGIVDESAETKPTSAYGKVKLLVLDKIQGYCSTNNLDWYWLRIFSVFGPGEDNNWLIPSLIQTMQKMESMDMTLGEQKYAYLFIDDFTHIIENIINRNAQAGVYNICSPNALSIKELALKILNLLNPNFKINFGALPYRNKQSMLVQGNISKLIHQIGEIKFTDVNLALTKTIEHYKYKVNL